jgi:phospholipase/carboxylesterase
MMTTKPGGPSPIVFVPRQGDPQLLFVLLHGESASPEQLFPLAEAVKKAFPKAMVVLPYADHLGGLMEAVPALIQQIRQFQLNFGLSGQQTALAGFSRGASMVLEASHAQADLAGRVLAFSGLYEHQPASAPPATMLHFFHGEDDRELPVAQARQTLEHLAELQGDATLDVASMVGHELHDALIQQAVVRLQTCVPLRNWEAALSSLQQCATDPASDVPSPAKPSGPTLH